jgi:hypothetical protein
MGVRLSRLFKTTVAWIGVPTLIAVATLLISINQFRLSQALIALSGIWIIGWIIFLPHNKFPINGKTEISLWGAILGTFFITGWLFYLVDGYRIDGLLAADHGWLSPADDWISLRECGSNNSDAKRLLLGNEIWVIESFPKNIIRVFNQSLLSIDFSDGKLSLSANIFDANGTVIAVIIKNEFDLNRNNYFKKKTPDLSTIIIYDQYNNEVLNLRFINSYTFRIKARINYKGQNVFIEDNSLLINGRTRIAVDCLNGRYSGSLVQIGPESSPEQRH